MQNPFKKDDAVLTKVKGRSVEATVTQTWKNEVQVKTTKGDLLWRSMYTVWRAGEEPLKREVAKAAPAASVADESNAQSPTPAPAATESAKPRTGGGASKSGKRKRRAR